MMRIINLRCQDMSDADLQSAVSEQLPDDTTSNVESPSSSVDTALVWRKIRSSLRFPDACVAFS